MPGNDTQYTSPRAFFPPMWIKTSIPAGQATGVPMDIAGVTTIQTLPMLRETSIVSVGIKLSAAVTAQFIRFELTIDGVATGQMIDMTSSDGTKKISEFAPGKIVLQKGEELGVDWGSHGGLLPSGTITALIAFEVQS